MSQIYLRRPEECSDSELDEFVGLVQQGGEVVAGNLRRRVLAADKLVFLRGDETLVGIAAVKNPDVGYRSGVARKSGLELPSSVFPYELGWVFVPPVARGNGYATRLVGAAVSNINGSGMFATSRTSNGAMHRILLNFGFELAGISYLSTRGEYELQVFTKVPG